MDLDEIQRRAVAAIAPYKTESFDGGTLIRGDKPPAPELAFALDCLELIRVVRRFRAMAENLRETVL